MGAAGFQPHLLQDMGHVVSDGRSGGQRQVYDAEGTPQTVGRLHKRPAGRSVIFKGGFLDNVRHFGDVAVPSFGQGGADNTGTGDSTVDDAVWFPGPW